MKSRLFRPHSSIARKKNSASRENAGAELDACTDSVYEERNHNVEALCLPNSMDWCLPIQLGVPRSAKLAASLGIEALPSSHAASEYSC